MSDWYKTCVSSETHHLTTSSRHKHIMRLSFGLMDSSLLKFKLCKFVTTSLGVPKRIRKHCVCSRMVIIKIAYLYLLYHFVPRTCEGVIMGEVGVTGQ